MSTNNFEEEKGTSSIETKQSFLNESPCKQLNYF